jgi:LysR family cys regulon transcriptional activator
MNLHQFRFVQEAVRRDLNLTETAKALFTSQPGVSKAILELEGELGVDIFARHGKRLRRVTEPGREVLKAIEVIMREVGNLKRIGDEFSKQDAGTLSIATTHSQARYFLPVPIAQMRSASPRSTSACTRERPSRSPRWSSRRSPTSASPPNRSTTTPTSSPCPCYAWQHVLVLPTGHPLAQLDRISIEDLAPLPLISYHPSFSGRKRIDAAFATRKLVPNIVLEAIDADVIKTYVRLGLGIGIVAEIAMREEGADRIWSPGRSATCSARTSPGSRSSAAPTCATSSTRSPR